MKTFQAIIFDLDGVIVDSEPRHERAFLDVFTQMGYAENHGIDFHSFVGTSDRTVWLDFIARHRPTQALEDLMAWKQRQYLEVLRRDRPIFPLLPELVEKLSAHYPLAVASGSLHAVIDEVLALKNLRQHFQAVVSSQDVAHPKPAPDIFLRAAQLLGLKPGQCCVIEDSAAGVQAACAAGMEVIAITNTLPRERLQKATHVVENYGEIERLLLS